MGLRDKLGNLSKVLFRIEDVGNTDSIPEKEPITKPEPVTNQEPVAAPVSLAPKLTLSIELPTLPGEPPFLEASLLARLPILSPDELDELEFGCTKLDNDGRALFYNRWQSAFDQLFSPDEALGKHFFAELAPSTNNSLVFGRFQHGVAEGSLNEVFSYAFLTPEKPTLAKVHLYRDARSKTNWILVQRVEVPELRLN
jgi:photoactive yellow protein